MAGLLHLTKQASSTTSKPSSMIRDAAQIAATMGLATGGAVMADKAINMAGTQMYKAKIPSIIRYAMKKHPELKDVGEKKLKQWALGIYSVSPKVASNNELASDALYQIYQYGGNFDLATVKMLADVTRGTKDNNVPYITAGNAMYGNGYKAVHSGGNK